MTDVSSEAYLGRARNLRRRGAESAAAALLREAVQIFPQDPDLRDHLASILWDLGEREASVESWQQSLRLRPDFECPRLILAFNLQELGRMDESFRTLCEGLDACPRSRYIWLTQMAALHAKTGDVPKALELCDETVVEFPDKRKWAESLRRSMDVATEP